MDKSTEWIFKNFSNKSSLSVQVVEEDVDHITVVGEEEDVDHIGVLGEEEEETRVRIFYFCIFVSILFATCSGLAL